MSDNNTNKDVANSLIKYSDMNNKGVNAVLDSANQINKWYEDKLNKIADNEIDDGKSRLETNADNESNIDLNNEKSNELNKIETKVDSYDELQTNKNLNESVINKGNRIKTILPKDDDIPKQTLINKTKNNIGKNAKANKFNHKSTKAVATTIKGAKTLNNVANKTVKYGRNINTASNEGGTKAFQEDASRIMTRPIKNFANNVTDIATNKIKKETSRFVKNNGKRIIKGTTDIIQKTGKLVIKAVEDTMKMILSLVPSSAPIIIIIMIVAALGSFFNFGSTAEADDVDFDEATQYIIEIDDPDVQLVYSEFLKNIGKTYLMDHSNLSYDTCMSSYDCSSWVIHCFAHTGLKTIPDTTASGIYNDYCNSVEVSDRQPLDLIFLKDTYETEAEDGISHVGIYMGTLTINGETAEWIIDTGGNPEGVKITKYQNGWWNSETYFYGFGRLK